MVFNDAARQLLIKAGENIDVVIHDWWVYLVVSGCGGSILYDPYPSLRYRQHNSNLIGGNSNWSDRFRRVPAYWTGQFRDWNDCNIRVLQKMRGTLTPDNRRILDEFSRARRRSLLPRMIGLKRSGIYRQTALGNISLFFAAIFGKI